LNGAERKLDARPFRLSEDPSFYADYLAKSRWDALLPTETSRGQFSRCGFYAYEDPNSTLTFLALNTNLVSWPL
jgi:hypothetical protein